MSLLVYKYSVQEKKLFDKDWLEGLSENKILFDELDFYCFITYFDEKELRKMFSEYGVKTIEMNNIDVIAKSVLNIFDYYDILSQTKASAIEVLSCQQKSKSVLRCSAIWISLKISLMLCVNSFSNMSFF